jgi:hypothetical protein
MKNFDVVVLHTNRSGCTPRVVKELKDAGVKYVLGYITIGEDDVGPGETAIVGDGLGPVYVNQNTKDMVLEATGIASFYVDSVWNSTKNKYVHNNKADINGTFGGYFIYPNAAWRQVLKAMRIGGSPEVADRKYSAGLDQIAGDRSANLDSRNENFGFDGFFLDTIDTAGPYQDVGWYPWTAEEMSKTVKFISDTYPDKTILGNRGIFFYQGGLYNSTYDVRPIDYTIRPYVNMVLFESYMLDSDPLHTGLSPYYLDNKINQMPNLMAEANRPDGFTVCGIDYMADRGDTPPEYYYSHLFNESVLQNGWMEYLTLDGSIETVETYISNLLPAAADTTAPTWLNTSHNTNEDPPNPLDPRVGVQQVVNGSNQGEIIVRWDAAIDQTWPIKYNIYLATNPDFSNQVKYAAVPFEKGEGWNADPVANVANQFKITNLSPGTTYYVSVRAEDSSVANNEDSNTVTLSITVTNAISTDLDTVDIPEGGTASFKVRLYSQPASDVTVSVANTSGDSDITVSSGSSLLFTMSDWNVEQTVTVAAAEDADTVNGSASITCSASGIISKIVTANEVDNDFTLTVTNDGNGTTNPSGASVRTKGASIGISATAATGYYFLNWTVTSGTATFGNTNASTTVAASENTTIRANFVKSISILTDLDVVNVSEGGTASFKVRLGAQPTTSKTVYVQRASGDTNITILSGAILYFTTTNWSTGQDVTLAAAEDADTANGSATISCTSTGITTKNVTANEVDNDFTLTVSNYGNGTTTPTGAKIVDKHDSPYSISAKAKTNYHFANWSVLFGSATFGDANVASTSVTASANTTICANFARNTATLTLTTNGNGTAGFTSVNPLDTGTETSILATPAANNHFVNWTLAPGSASATITNAKSATTTVMLTGGHRSSVTITANFAIDTAPTAVPATPAISATDGTYEDRVVITWKAVPDATSYVIYRNTVNSTDGIRSLGETTDTIFEDNTAEFNTVSGPVFYYYFAKAKNSKGDSLKYSAGNLGYVAKAPVAPGAVTASDGTYFDKISVSWAKVANATSYKVFRTTENTPKPNPLVDTPLSETTALFFDDFGDDIVPQVGGIVKKYYYWIAAKNHNAVTEISSPNEGYLSNKGPATVTASVTYTDRIVVTWAAVPGATSYDVYRFPDSKSSNGDLVESTVKGLECVDKSLAASKYYRVKAKYGVYYSDFSLTGAMGKLGSALPPNGITLMDNGEISLNSGIKGSSMYFSTEVPMGINRLVATLDGTTNAVTNDCNLFAKFANFPSTTSYNAKGVESKMSEELTISNPLSGTWYFLLYGVTAYSNVTLTVNCYSIADIVLTQIPVNDLPVPFTAEFKGKVIDEAVTGIPNIILQSRNPITGLTNTLTKTDVKGIFSYSALISTEGTHTFDFFFSDIPDNAKGTASHTVATRKGCIEPNNFFDSSRYVPAMPITIPDQADVVKLQTFLDIRNGWDVTGASPSDYETMWINNTIVKAENDAQLPRSEGLYMYFYGVEGAGIGNDTTANCAFTAVPFVVHVAPIKKDTVLGKLKDLGIITTTQYGDLNGVNGKIGIVAVTAASNPGETLGNYNISLLAREQLEILANIAAGFGVSIDYLGVKKITLKLANDREINVIVSAFVK